jgi:cell division protein FtsA
VLRIQAEQMKVQFGSALTAETKSNAVITIPGLKGMPAKEIRVQNLAHIIQARMTEILEFVTYHLKQVELDARALSGGIILTGGGSQLMHLKQLTEYVTGLSARIGLPNEHLAANHIDELTKPMYSTCIGLILTGYNDFEHKRKEFESRYAKVEVPESFKKDETEEAEKAVKEEKTKAPKRKKEGSFWDKFKDGLIDVFREEPEKMLK